MEQQIYRQADTKRWHLSSTGGFLSSHFAIAFVQEWRSQSYSGLCVFAQGATAATDVLISFLPRAFELVKPNEALYPVAVDIHVPMPIHLRTAASGFLTGVP